MQAKNKILYLFDKQSVIKTRLAAEIACLWN